MAVSFTYINDLIRDYFQYRNLTSTSRIFETDLSKLPSEQYRADRVIERLTIHIHQYELNNLIDYWTQIEQHLLSTINIESQQLLNVFKKIRINLYRCYLIHAVQSSKTDKINEFFDRLTKTLQQTNEWTKEWFTLPFIKNPEENSLFEVYFSKQWIELFWTSLQNFLSLAFYNMSPPLISNIDEDNSPSFGTLINPPSTIPKSLININPSISEPVNSAVISSQSTNATILSKLRNKFLPTMKQSQDELQSLATSSIVESFRKTLIDDSISTTKPTSSKTYI